MKADWFENNFEFSVVFTALAAVSLLFLIAFIIEAVMLFARNRDRRIDNTWENRGERMENDYTQKNGLPNQAEAEKSAVEAPLPAGIQIGISSKIGTRKYQQDSIVVMDGKTLSDLNSKKCIAVLCDGMGGMEGGELASAVTAKTLYTDYCQMNPQNIPSFFVNEVKKLDDIVCNLRDSNNRIMDSGSTLVCAVIEDSLLYWVSVGDSRIYILRKNEMVQVTTDHNYYSVLKSRVKQGLISQADADNDPRKEALISYIGIGKDSEIGYNEKPIQLENGDMILLCSDGLFKTLTEAEIASIAFNYRNNAEIAAEKLTEAAIQKKRRGQDNTSVALILFNGKP